MFSSFFVGSVRLYSRFIPDMPLLIYIILHKTAIVFLMYDGGVGLCSLIFEKRFFREAGLEIFDLCNLSHLLMGWRS